MKALTTLNKRLTRGLCALLVVAILFGMTPTNVFSAAPELPVASATTERTPSSLTAGSEVGYRIHFVASEQRREVIIPVYVTHEFPEPDFPTLITRHAIPGARIIVYRDGVKQATIHTTRDRSEAFFRQFIDSPPGQWSVRLDYVPGYVLCQKNHQSDTINLELEFSLGGVYSANSTLAPGRPRFFVVPVDSNVTHSPVEVSTSTPVPPVEPNPLPTPTPPLVLPPVPGNNTLHVIGAPVGGHPVAIVNGNRLDVNPIIHDGNTLVPLRAIADAFGADVSWNGPLQQITVYMPWGNVYLVVGSTAVRGTNIPLTVSPLNEDGTVFMPARFFAYLFNAEVSFAPYPG